MHKFHNSLYELKQYYCEKCKEMWPTCKNECSTCSKLSLSDKNMFTEYNNMDPCLLLLPNNIKSMLENLTMVEEMLTYPVLPFMAIHRTSRG